MYDIPQITVAHKGKLWRNTFRTIGEEPGKIGIRVWQAIGLDFNTTPQFSANEYYEVGNVVLKDGGLWQSTVNQRGESPGKSGVWVLVGYSSAQGTRQDNFNPLNQGNNDALGNKWDRNNAYLVQGTVVTHHGILWTNSAPAAVGDEPGVEGVETWYMVGTEREEQLPTWNQAESYPLSSAVQHGQYIWISRRVTAGVEPGKSRDWLLVGTVPSKTLPWDFGKWYAQGTTIQHLGNRWFSIRDTQGERPGDSASSNKWVLFEEHRLSGFISIRNWRPGDAYPLIGTIVKYLEREWVNTNAVFFDPVMPSSSKAWELLNKGNSGASAAVTSAVNEDDVQWQPSRIYNVIGTIVLYEGVKYRNLIEVTGGNPPSQNTQAWRLLSQDVKADSNQQANSPPTSGSTANPAPSDGTSTGGVSTPNAQPNSIVVDENARWNSETIYDIQGKVVQYQGTEWINSHWTKGDVPGQSVVWQPRMIKDGDPWSKFVIYDSSRAYSVLYQGKKYKNKYWTQGDEPGVSAAWGEEGDFAAINGADWKPGAPYTLAKMKAKHLGRMWYNLWPTTGQEPGASEVWQPEVLQDDEPWSRYTIYDYKSRGEPERMYRVTYNGRIWVNRWWTQGEMPGVSDAWQAYAAGAPK